MPATRTTLALALALALGCSADLTPQSEVTRLRVLGIRAQPADALPGDPVAVDALVADPLGDGRPVAYLWVACVLGARPDPAACTDPSGSAILGIGLGPAFSFTAPAVPDGEESSTILLSLLLCAGGSFTLPGPDDPPGPPQCSGGESALAYKRVTVSLAPEPNRNPRIERLLLAGEPLAPTETLVLPACTEEADCPVWTLQASLHPDSAETFTSVEFGSPVERTENVFTSWFADAGDFERIRTGGLEPDNRWAQPPGPAVVDLWAVVHDGRGGADWLARRIELR